MPPDPEKINSEFLIMQYEQAMETFRHGVTSLAQLVTVFVLADITLLGFAIDNKIAGIIFLGALFPVFIMNSASVVGKLLAPTIFTAYCIEQKCGEEISGLMHTGLRVNLSPEVAQKLEAVSVMTSVDAQASQLQKIDISMFGRRKNIVNSLLILVTLIHVMAPLLLTSCFSWRLL
ncbi:MAG: hypothetical protein ACREOI_00285 [bacterium]